MGAMLNGQPRRTVRSRRSSSIIAQAIAVLAKYGGSLWVASPDYTFTGSDGTGAAGDNSDAGYVRDLCAAYGAELVTNGDFSNGLTGWATNGGTSTVVSGEAELTSGASGYGALYQVVATKTGVSYLVTGKVRCGTVGSVALRARNVGATSTLGAATVTSTTTQDVSFTFTADGVQSTIQLLNNSATADLTSYADNISVREIIGRPLFQPTTGFKPKLRRVPKRLGVELVTNGDFAAGSAGWVGVTAGVSFTGGVMNLVSSSGEYQGAAQNNIIQVGKTYVAQADVVINSGVGGVTLSSGATNVTQTTTGKLYGTFTATTHYIEVKRFAGAVNATVDNVSVREVLEWGWAWVFDGVDDILSTASLPAGTDETIMVCATSLTSAGTARAPIGKRNLNNGVFIRRESGGALNAHAMTGSGFGAMVLETPHTNFQPFVATVSAKSGASRGRLDGSQVATTSGVYAGWAGPLGVGSEKGMDSGTQWNGYVFVAAYAPVAIPDAELLIVERAMAQLAGVTI